MDIKYVLYGKELEENSQAIGSEQAITLSVMKIDERMWYKGEMMIYEGQKEGADPVELLGPFANPYDAGKYYIKLIKLLPTVEDDE